MSDSSILSQIANLAYLISEIEARVEHGGPGGGEGARVFGRARLYLALLGSLKWRFLVPGYPNTVQRGNPCLLLQL